MNDSVVVLSSNGRDFSSKIDSGSSVVKFSPAYAGCNHSLFETREGKIHSCGYNKSGQLLLNNSSREGNIYLPREKTITEGAIFCIAGYGLSTVFVGGKPPPNTPNMRIQHHQ